MQQVAFKMPREDYTALKKTFERLGLTAGAGIRFALGEFMDRRRSPGGKMTAWAVTLDGKPVETVFFLGDMTAAAVKVALIEEHGFAPGIEVERAKL